MNEYINHVHVGSVLCGGPPAAGGYWSSTVRRDRYVAVLACFRGRSSGPRVHVNRVAFREPKFFNLKSTSNQSRRMELRFVCLHIVIILFCRNIPRICWLLRDFIIYYTVPFCFSSLPTREERSRPL
jgi:hypothetical protein